MGNERVKTYLTAFVRVPRQSVFTSANVQKICNKYQRKETPVENSYLVLSVSAVRDYFSVKLHMKNNSALFRSAQCLPAIQS